MWKQKSNLSTTVEKIKTIWQHLWLQPVLSSSIHIITELKPTQDLHLENNLKPCSRRWHDATRCQLVFLLEDSNSGTLSAAASCQLQQEAAGVQQAQGARTQHVLKWDSRPLTFLQLGSNRSRPSTVSGCLYKTWCYEADYCRLSALLPIELLS